jgi:hypothetical protein
LSVEEKMLDAGERLDQSMLFGLGIKNFYEIESSWVLIRA